MQICVLKEDQLPKTGEVSEMQTQSISITGSKTRVRYVANDHTVITNNYLVLWHGTTKSCALSIVKTGFCAHSYFAESIMPARHRAMDKQNQDNPGMLMLCVIDLNSYAKHDYVSKKAGIYQFTPKMPRDVLAGVFEIESYSIDQLEEKAELLKIRPQNMKCLVIGDKRAGNREYTIVKHTGPEIIMTRNCGAEAIAYWINMYLGIYYIGQQARATHPGIKMIRKWIEKNYIHGRLSPISDQEMLMQVKRYLPRFFTKFIAAVSTTKV